jgi:hypothetical protein
MTVGTTIEGTKRETLTIEEILEEVVRIMAVATTLTIEEVVITMAVVTTMAVEIGRDSKIEKSKWICHVSLYTLFSL